MAKMKISEDFALFSMYFMCKFPINHTVAYILEDGRLEKNIPGLRAGVLQMAPDDSRCLRDDSR